MGDQPPFILTRRADGLHELRAFSDTTVEPIILVLDHADGRRLGVAVADMLTALDAGVARLPIELEIAERRVVITGTVDQGMRLTVI